MNQEQYIKAHKQAFIMGSSYKSEDTRIRSLEKYLEKNNLFFNLDGDNYIIYINSKSEAIRVGSILKLHSVEYFDGMASSTITLNDDKTKQRRTKMLVTDNKFGDILSLQKHNKKTLNEINSKFIEFRDIIKKDLLTKKKLIDLVSNGMLVEFRFKNKNYINRSDLHAFLTNKQMILSICK